MPPSSALSVHDSKIAMSVSNQNKKQARSSWALRGRKGSLHTAVSGPSPLLPIPKQDQAGAADREKER